VKGPAFEPRVLALAHDPLDVLLGDLQIAEHHALNACTGPDIVAVAAWL
jgi:hypothetical protein